MSKTIVNDEYIEIISNDFKLKNKIASFDLDNTLIKTKSGKTFPIDETDWIFNFDNVTEVLNQYHGDNYCLIIISNQKNLEDKKLESWVTKIKDIINKIGLPVKVYASIKDNIYRKPNTGLWNLIKIKVNMIDSFYCGDAMGRKNDHSDTDLKFALNLGLTFKSPETVFQNKFLLNPKIKNYFDFNNFSKLDNNYKVGEKELIIMVGYPGSGKSTFVKKYLIKNNFESINQDKLKSKKKCLDMCEKYMKQEQNIVVDNTNSDLEIRKLYIDLGKKYNYNIRCFIMNTTEEHARHNNMYRYLYQNKEKVPDIVYRIFNKKYKLPQLSEGFKDIVNINPEVPSRVTDSKYYFYLY
jgi:bifunctional polynucleotide phosphatase/kinase